MGNDNEVRIYGNSGNRVLSPSLTHVKSTGAVQFGTASDSAHRSGIGEEKVAEADERLIYQAALEVFSSLIVGIAIYYMVKMQHDSCLAMVNTNFNQL